MLHEVEDANSDLESFLRNTRVAQEPGLTAAVIATLTLGIGATTAIYTVVYATLLAPLPYPESQSARDRLVEG